LPAAAGSVNTVDFRACASVTVSTAFPCASGSTVTPVTSGSVRVNGANACASGQSNASTFTFGVERSVNAISAGKSSTKRIFSLETE
jgi:hypothetical protein